MTEETTECRTNKPKKEEQKSYKVNKSWRDDEQQLTDQRRVGFIGSRAAYKRHHLVPVSDQVVAVLGHG